MAKQKQDSWDDLQAQMESFGQTVDSSRASLGLTNREITMYNRNMRLLNINMARLNLLIPAMMSRADAPGGMNAPPPTMDKTLVDAIKANTNANTSTMRAIAANTAAMRTFSLLAAGAAVASTGAAINSANAAKENRTNTPQYVTDLPMEPVNPQPQKRRQRELTPVQMMEQDAKKEEQRQKKNQAGRDRRREKRMADLDKQTKKVMGVYIEYPDEAVPNVPLEREGDAPPNLSSPEERRKTKQAEIDEKSRQRDADFRKKHNLPSDFPLERIEPDAKDKPPLSGDFPDMASMEKAVNKHESYNRGQRTRATNQLEKDLAADAAKKTGGPGGTPPPGPTGAGASPPRGGDLRNIMVGILTQITKLTIAATTDSTIYVRDSRANDKLRNILAAVGAIHADMSAPPPPGPSSSPGSKDKKSSASDDLASLSNAGFAATSSMVAMTSLADPSVFSTFTGSLRLLTQEIGSMFVPMVREMAYRIQDVTEWFGSFSEETRRTVGYVGLGVAGFTGFTLAARGLGAGLGIAGSALGMLGKTAAFVFSPAGLMVGGGIAALTSGVALATGNWNNLTAAIKETGQALWGVGKDAVNAVGNLQGVAREQSIQEKIKLLPDERLREGFIGKKPEEIDKFVAEEVKRLQAEIKVEQGKLGPELGRVAEKEKKQREAVEPFRQRLETEYKKAYSKFEADMQSAIELNPESDYIFRDQLKDGNLPVGSGRAYEQQMKEVRGRLVAGQAGVPFKPEEVDSLFQQFRTPEGGRFTPPTRDRMMETQIERPPLPEELKIKGMEKLIEQMGSLGRAFGVSGQKQRIDDIVSPVQARYTDAVAYRESAQLQALNVQDTRTIEAERQINALNGIKGILAEIKQIQQTENNRLIDALKQVRNMQP